METKSSCVTIQDLPEEVFRYLAQFLAGPELDACSDVCKKWRFIFNSNKIWKRCCFYPEKFFKADTEFRLQQCTREKTSSEMCTWRQYYKLEQSVCNNLSKGNFSVSNSGIIDSSGSMLSDYVDDKGNHWLFSDDSKTGISVWNITRTPLFYDKIKEVGHFSFCFLGDRFLTFQTDYVKVFQFIPEKHELNRLFRFRFKMDSILPDDEVVSDDHFYSGARYILTDHFYVGYMEDISGDIHETFLHIWDLNSGKKLSTISAFQQSYVDYVKLRTGRAFPSPFYGGLVLFSGTSRRFLVALINDSLKLCQVSLFSLDDLNFVNVIAQVESRTVWCFMKDDIITIYYLCGEKSSLLSVYNTNGQFLAKLDFSANYNPAFSNEFWFSGSRVILKPKVEKKVCVLSISKSQEVSETSFETAKGTCILSYYDPKFLLTNERPDRCSENRYSAPGSLTVWDVDAGVKLWHLDNIVSLNSYGFLYRSINYPRQFIVVFNGEKEMSILNFENAVAKAEHSQLERN